MLFETGRSVYAPPLKFIYNLEGTGSHPVAMAVSVPKRLFKKAVDRNLIKRRIREAYRLNKKELYGFLSDKELKINLVIQFQNQEISSYRAIESGMVQGMKKILHLLIEKP
jgi:ribonuclease P protein component